MNRDEEDAYEFDLANLRRQRNEARAQLDRHVKWASEQGATLTEALRAAGDALREEIGGWTRASAKAANIIEAALAAVRGERTP